MLAMLIDLHQEKGKYVFKFLKNITFNKLQVLKVSPVI